MNGEHDSGRDGDGMGAFDGGESKRLLGADPTSGTTYKVLGELAAAEGTGILGRNTAGSGTPIGVQASVPNADGYGFSTPDDARVGADLTVGNAASVGGDVDVGGDLTATSGHSLVVEGAPVQTFGGQGTDSFGTTGGGNVVGGYEGNRASGVVGAAIAGGGASGEFPVRGSNRDNVNEVSDNYGAIGGGLTNRAGWFGVVGGGYGNTATATSGFSVVCGGEANVADGLAPTVCGGKENTASGNRTAVVGGKGNVAGGKYAFVGGGRNNEVTGVDATVGGGRNNDARARYATIGGGGPSNDTDSSTRRNTRNVVFDEYGTVGGGGGNRAGNSDGTTGSATFATVAGGKRNLAKKAFATIGGGSFNEIQGKYGTIAGGGPSVPSNYSTSTETNNLVRDDYGTVGGGGGNRVGTSGSTDATFATVPGGRHNTAAGTAAFAAGEDAVAEDDHAFVWNDGSGYHAHDEYDDGFSSSKTVASSDEPTGAATFNVSASGGVRMVTGTSAVTYVPSGSAGWSQTSSRAAKTDVRPVDPERVLAGVESLDVHTWRYDGSEDDGTDGGGPRRVGPMAEDFHEAIPVEVGDSDEHINSVDADGVALAAIRGLADRLERTRETLARKEGRIEELEATVTDREELIEDLRASNERLRERLDAVEKRLATLEGSRTT